MSEEDTKGQSGAEDQNEEQGENLDQQEDTHVKEQNESQDENRSEDEGSDDATQGEGKFKKAFEDQKRRAEKAEADAKALRDRYEPKKENRRAPQKDDEALSALEKRVIRAELAGVGIKDADEQEFVIGAAQRLGIDPAQAASDAIVAAKLERMREEKATKDATPTPTKGGGQTSRKAKNAWDMSDEEFNKEVSRIMTRRA